MRPPKAKRTTLLSIRKPSFTLRTSKHWRHLSILALAGMVAAIGVEQQSLSQNIAGANNSLPSISLPLRQAAVLLPSIQSIDLPPIPVKNSGVKEPFIAANHVILVDQESKIPLYEKQPHERVAMASTTKIATAMVALEEYDINETITASESATSVIGSAVTFRAGEQVTIEQLLHGLLIVSGNDAALLLAEHLGNGDTSMFVRRMNELAKRLGMDDTYFYDPAGLNDQGYSTASDMAKLMSYAINNKTLAKIIHLGEYEYTSPEGYLHVFKNSNRLVTPEMLYNGIIGGKTGYTPKTTAGGAGHCLITAAERNGHRLIAIVLDTHKQTPEASAEVTRTLFDYGFNNFTWQEITR